MFVETSAVVEFLTDGPLANTLTERIEASTTPFYASPIVELEAAIALAARLHCSVPAAHERAVEFLDALDATRMDITLDVGRRAVAAYATYGKGRGHSARLNFGDCLSYAAAKTAKVPLLYVGNDFAQTDLA